MQDPKPNLSFKKSFKISAHGLNIESMTINSQENIILTCSRDKNIKLWGFSPDIGLILRETFSNHSSSVLSLKPISTFYKPHFFVSLSTDESMKFWDFSQKKCIKSLGLQGSITSFMLFEKKIFAACGRDNLYIIKSLDLFDGTVLQEFKGHSDVVSALAICQNPKILISTSRDRTIVFWSLKSKNSFLKPLKTHQKMHKQGITSMIMLEEKGALVTGSNDNTIKIWVVKPNDLSLLLLKTLSLHKGWILTLHLLSENYFASSGADDSIRVWNCKNWECEAELKDAMFSPGSLLFIKKKKLLLAGDKNGELRGWELFGEI